MGGVSETSCPQGEKSLENEELQIKENLENLRRGEGKGGVSFPKKLYIKKGNKKEIESPWPDDAKNFIKTEQFSNLFNKIFMKGKG